MQGRVFENPTYPSVEAFVAVIIPSALAFAVVVHSEPATGALVGSEAMAERSSRDLASAITAERRVLYVVETR